MADKKKEVVENLPPAPEDPAPGTFEPGTVPAPADDRHPAPIRGYDVLDLTTAYNLGHPDAPVAGFFRLTRQDDPSYGTDVVTDGPYFVPGRESRLTRASEQLIKATIANMEALRKVL